MRWPARVGAAWLGWRLFGPDLPPAFPPGQEYPVRLPGRTVFVADREVFVREAGSANRPVLALLHGLGLDSMLSWHRLIPLLAERFRIVAIDLPGAGKSDGSRDRFDIADLADDVAGACAALGITRATIVGYSMGGAVAQEVARRHPGLTERLVLVSTLSHHPFWWRVARTLVAVGGRALERISRKEVSWAWYRYLLAVGAVERRHARWLWETRMSRDPEFQYRSMLTLLRFDSRPWLAKLDVPTLVLISGSDQLVPPSWQRALAATIPGAETVEVPGATHELPMTHADEVAEALFGWIQ